MSVILGFQSNEKIILAADNRSVNMSGDLVSDKSKKIVSVNDHLAVAFCGNAAIQAMFEWIMNSFGEERKNYYVDDALLWLKEACLVFKNSKEVFADNVISMLSNFIIAGINDKEQMIMYSVSFKSGELSECIMKISLFTPPDVSFEKYADKYVSYLHTDAGRCMKKIIKEISRESNMVSKSGDIWTYYPNANNSKIRHFY